MTKSTHEMNARLRQFDIAIAEASKRAEIKALEQFAEGAGTGTQKDREPSPAEVCARTAAMRLVLAARDRGYEITTVYDAEEEEQDWSVHRDGVALGPAIDAMVACDLINVRFQMPGSAAHRFTVMFVPFNCQPKGASPEARYSEAFADWSCPAELMDTVTAIVDEAAGNV